MKKTQFRRISQIIFFLGLLWMIWSTKYPLIANLNPSLFFQLDPFAMTVTAVAERVLLAGLGYSLFTLALTLIFGRVFCGWFCPLGALQDLWVYLAGFFKKKFREARPSGAVITKYLILAAVFLAALLGIQAAWALDPFAIFVRAFSFNIFPWLNRIIDGAFILVLKNMGSPGAVEKVYYFFKDNIISLNSPVFPHTLAVFSLFLAILALALFKRRFWCRFLCPLGAMLALVTRFAPYKRVTGACKENCSLCRGICRMNAINPDNTYIKEECVLCMDCIDKCPGASSKFSFKPPAQGAFRENNNEKGITRAQFLGYLTGTLAFVFGLKAFAGSGGKFSRARVIRPPAALPEAEFVQRCIRCGNCMKVCPTNVLQPAIFESGLSGVWTPKYDTRIGYCEFKCNLCGRVCPTSAIRSISAEEKMRTRMGLAEIDQRICLPWAKGEECIVCEEHCPVADKAITLVETKGKDGRVLKLPSVDPNLCVGCAICEFKCPVSPEKAIKVKPL